MKKQEDMSISFLVLVIIAVILVIINISLFINIMKIRKEMDNNTDTDTVQEDNRIPTQEEQKAATIQKLKKMNERDRMEFYIGEYIGYIEEKKYNEAYNLLYPEFKDNYFKSLEDFEKYVKRVYPAGIIMQYENIERQGDYYVLFTNIVDEDDLNNVIEQNIIVKENGYDDFYLSFDASK